MRPRTTCPLVSARPRSRVGRPPVRPRRGIGGWADGSSAARCGATTRARRRRSSGCRRWWAGTRRIWRALSLLAVDQQRVERVAVAAVHPVIELRRGGDLLGLGEQVGELLFGSDQLVGQRSGQPQAAALRRRRRPSGRGRRRQRSSAPTGRGCPWPIATAFAYRTSRSLSAVLRLGSASASSEATPNQRRW